MLTICNVWVYFDPQITFFHFCQNILENAKIEEFSKFLSRTALNVFRRCEINDPIYVFNQRQGCLTNVRVVRDNVVSTLNRRRSVS